MQVLSICSTKGGVGKTTLAASIAVAATREGLRVALIDLDPQESLKFWYAQRGFSDPQVMHGQASARKAVSSLGDDYDLAILDGPPGFLNSVEEMVINSDLVVIPTKTSMLDILGSEEAIASASKHGKPCIVVLNDVYGRDGSEKAALAFLTKAGLRVAKTKVKHSVAHIRGMSSGMTAQEVDGGRHRSAAQDISNLWEEISQELE